MNITSNNLTFTSAAGVRNVVVNDGGNFTVEYEVADWYTISYSIPSGLGYGVVSVSVTQNKAASSRGGQFIIKSASKSETVTFVQSRPEVPSNPESVEYTLNRNTHEFTVAMPSDYEAVATPSADWISVAETKASDSWTVTIAANNTGEARTGSVVVATTDSQTISTVEVEQAAEALLEGELLIEEIYFAGVLLEDGKSSSASDGDQYFKITNNTSEIVYADGLLICESSYMSNRASTGSYWIPQEVPTEAIGISTAFQIPGDGDDVPVAAGESIVIAIAAQDFSADGGTDLSKADFEISYSGFPSYFPDTDNPDVPNLDVWFQNSFTYYIIHQRGYGSYAIVLPPDGMDADTFMEEYAWNGKEDFYLFGEWYRTRDILSGNYLVPNDWVIDGVNMGVEQFLGDLAFNASVDAGYTGCGKIDSDPDRFGKSALRKTDGGKLVDTNNSTNDFEPNATPSLK